MIHQNESVQLKTEALRVTARHQGVNTKRHRHRHATLVINLFFPPVEPSSTPTPSDQGGRSRARRAYGNDERYSNKCCVDYRWRRRPRRVQMHLPPKKHSINHTCSAGFRHGARRRPMAREQQTHNMYCCCVFCCEQWDPFCYLSDAKLSAADRYPCPAAHEYCVAYIRYMLTLYCLEGLWGGG